MNEWQAQKRQNYLPVYTSEANALEEKFASPPAGYTPSQENIFKDVDQLMKTYTHTEGTYPSKDPNKREHDNNHLKEVLISDRGRDKERVPLLKQGAATYAASKAKTSTAFFPRRSKLQQAFIN